MNKPIQLEGVRTLTQSAYRRIRGDLLSGSIAPENKLHIVDLSQRFGTSPSAIREALSRLVAERLVTVEEQKGFRAAPMSVTEFREITDLRVTLEVQALRRSIESGGEEWEAGIVAAHYRVALAEKRLASREAEADAESDWESRNRDFHDSLVMACQSEWLMRLRSLLYDHSRRYRHRTLQTPALLESSAREHEMLRAATLARDVDKACSLVSQHYMKTYETYRDHAGKS
jgi:DNA-binding GntR family transcriptional regulator